MIRHMHTQHRQVYYIIPEGNTAGSGNEYIIAEILNHNAMTYFTQYGPMNNHLKFGIYFTGQWNMRVQFCLYRNLEGSDFNYVTTQPKCVHQKTHLLDTPKTRNRCNTVNLKQNTQCRGIRNIIHVASPAM